MKIPINNEVRKPMKKSLFVFWLFFIILFQCTPPGPKRIIKDNLNAHFKAIDAKGTVVLYNMKKKTYTLCNEALSSRGILPASTFKIYNALIGLETKAADSTDYVIAWDGITYQFPEWNKDHTLQSAIKNSVVWYFQELARRIGKSRMETYIKKLPYGNMDISKGIDTFWLEGNLKISAREQVDLLRRLYSHELPFSESTQEQVKEIIILEKNEVYTLRGKNGTVSRLADVYYSWFVGYLEKDNNVHFFAVNLEKDKSAFKFGEAKEITIKILKEMKIL